MAKKSNAKTSTNTNKSKKKIFCGICSDWEIKRPEKCSNTIIRSGRKYYFCTKKCKERFETSAK